jgi:hypothetical protein
MHVATKKLSLSFFALSLVLNHYEMYTYMPLAQFAMYCKIPMAWQQHYFDILINVFCQLQLYMAYVVSLSLNQHHLGFYDFKSKTHQDACCPEGMCRAAVFALHVKEELTSWPEQSTRQRTWLTVPEAASRCRYQWMQEALLTGFTNWHGKWSKGGGGTNCDPA